jgi:hypothetical protein
VYTTQHTETHQLTYNSQVQRPRTAQLTSQTPIQSRLSARCAQHEPQSPHPCSDTTPPASKQQRCSMVPVTQHHQPPRAYASSLSAATQHRDDPNATLQACAVAQPLPTTLQLCAKHQWQLPAYASSVSAATQHWHDPKTQKQHCPISQPALRQRCGTVPYCVAAARRALVASVCLLLERMAYHKQPTSAWAAAARSISSTLNA